MTRRMRAMRCVAEAVSHEAGRDMGLRNDGISTVGHFQGHGSGASGVRRDQLQRAVPPASYCLSQLKNSAYQSLLLRGLSTQWFSSGNQSSRASTPCALSVL